MIRNTIYGNGCHGDRVVGYHGADSSILRIASAVSNRTPKIGNQNFSDGFGMTSSLIMLQDPYLVVTKKPPGVFVHRPEFWGRDESPFLQRIRRIVGQPLFPVHRLDRATSGLLLFGLSSEAAAALSRLFADRRITKSYSAIVRGFAPQHATIDIPLRPRAKPGHERKSPQDAETRIESLEYFEIPIQSDRYPTSRYTYLRAFPRTGRWHQIRRHLNSLNHPILGDTSHGDNTQNRFFRTRFQLQSLMLSATGLEFTHPFTGQLITVQCPLDDSFETLLTQLRPYQTQPGP